MQRDLSSYIAIVIALSITGGVFKVLGSALGNSKSTFVDALTSIANTLSIVLIYRYFKESSEPADRDHHYGHHKIALGGPVSTLMLYSFVAGVVLADLVEGFGKSYNVYIYAPMFAGLGLIPYAVGIAISRRFDVTLIYARFTYTEILEGVTTVAASLGGVLIAYYIDFVGAIALASYLFIELGKSFKEVVNELSDIAPREVVEELRKLVSSYGVKVDRVRVRKVIENVYYGDIVVKLPGSVSLEYAHNLVDRIEKELKQKLGVEVIIHAEPLLEKNR